ncbi:MAG: tRNA (adenosine(37)-N6)-threonylcarbamoyltransferase complex ATPase subunit type 1 TsaE [Planctomycetes bacterium]|nr:tRNA (adenosine(37)-N6)-threonylcarbamoyltransferase complex ATPase subunit type 1 TsaE [Planctomycetota bacterium]
MADPGRSFLAHTPEATEALGYWLGERVGAGSVLALDGELGAGKTTFVRALARGLGVAGPVTSPTYALLQTYPGRLELAHFDAWMERRERSFLAEGGWEWLGAEGVAVVEWAERVSEWLPEERLAIEFAHRGAEARSLRLRVLGDGPRARALAELVAAIPAREGLEESTE